MENIDNVYELEQGGSLSKPIKGVSGGMLHIGDGEAGKFIPLKPGLGGSVPKTHGRMLLQAAPAHQHDETPILVGKTTWHGCLLRVSTFRLCFENDRGSYFGDIHNAWPGAEQVRKPFVQVGERSWADQHQLIALNPGDWCVVADRHYRYMRIGCRGGELYAQPAQKIELAVLLIGRARLRLSTLPALRWTKYTLERLELSGMWPDDLQFRMKQLERIERA